MKKNIQPQTSLPMEKQTYQSPRMELIRIEMEPIMLLGASDKSDNPTIQQESATITSNHWSRYKNE